MATGFSTRSGPDGYRLNFDTDNLDYYLLMQKIARHCVDGKPAADVAPVRHGRWNDINPTVLNPGVHWVCRCSLCGCPQDYKHNYCPNCGARMDKEADHD